MPTAKKPDKGAKKKVQAATPATPIMRPVPAEVAASARPTPANPHNLPIVYDKLGHMERSTASPLGPLTVEDVKVMLWWETEKQYQARMVLEKPESRPEHWLFGDTFHCLDSNKQKVRCWNNANNRPFDMGWCEELIHTILHGQWAGPHTVPGETVNGETVRISRYGRVLSGQHQATALILADEYLVKSRLEAGNAANPRWPFWNGYDHPFIETLVVTGLSEDSRILQSIDYVKPRSLADMLYTLEVYRDKTSVERKEMTRMLAAAAEMLWDRTKTQGYKTHTEMAAFLERHRKLLKFVEHLHAENRPLADGGRRISNMRLSPGQCAALCYLMGSAGPKTDANKYRNGAPPSEKGLDWSMEARAGQFWSKLTAGRDDLTMRPVRIVLGRLVDSKTTDEDNMGLGGRQEEKLAVLAKAWAVFRDPDTTPLREADTKEGGRLYLTYTDRDEEGALMPDGKIELVDRADFGGIDAKAPGMSGAMPAPPSREEIERATEEARRRRGQQ